MFFYCTQRRFQFQIEFCQLSQHRHWLQQAAEWTEEKWGYIRKLGVAQRIQVIDQLKDKFYILSYGNQPIGMFALLDYPLADKTFPAKELSYVYIDKSFRGLGIGDALIEKAKALALSQNVELLMFDTLNPNVNHFYEKHQAHVLCESRILDAPTEIMRFR